MSNIIEPYTQTTTQVITSFTVSCRSLTLFEAATFTVDSFDANNNLISRQVLQMSTPEYLEWKNNDEFVVVWTADKLGYILVSPPISATVEVSQP